MKNIKNYITSKLNIKTIIQQKKITKKYDERIVRLWQETKKNQDIYNQTTNNTDKNFEKNNNIINFTANIKEILSYREKLLYNTLLQICKDLHLRICPKVRLADILEAQNLELKKEHMGYI